MYGMLQFLLLVFGGIVWDPHGPTLVISVLKAFSLRYIQVVYGISVSEYILFDQNLSSLFLKQF